MMLSAKDLHVINYRYGHVTLNTEVFFLIINDCRNDELTAERYYLSVDIN